MNSAETRTWTPERVERLKAYNFDPMSTLFDRIRIAPRVDRRAVLRRAAETAAQAAGFSIEKICGRGRAAGKTAAMQFVMRHLIEQHNAADYEVAEIVKRDRSAVAHFRRRHMNGQ